MMSNLFKPYDYQKKSIQHIKVHKRCGLFLDMSLGKTVCTLTAIDSFIYDSLEVNKVLVIAPKRVALDTWPNEVKKWKHLNHLRIAVAVGTDKQRRQAIESDADIYVINRENVVWLLDNYEFDYDMVVIDELSSFKSNSSQRFKALKKVIPRAKRVVGMTGTPSPNGLIDLWSQLYLIDGGKRLEKTIGKYRAKYFHPGRSNGYVVYDYLLNKGAEDEIYRKIDDICISMKKEDYLELPDKIFQNVYVEIDSKMMKFYEKMKKDEILRLGEETTIMAANAAAVSNKLQQIANGAVYDDEGNVEALHTSKLDALEELIEQANGSPVLVFYAFRHDRDAIISRFKNVHEINTSEDIAKWNAGEMPILIAHPASIGHGLNLQFGGHIIIWYGLTWSLENYLQANDRLHRMGQKNCVSIYHIVAKGTIDEAILQSLTEKDKRQNALMAYLKAEIEKLNSIAA